jgi:PAS domain S-box-containing protein
LIILLIAYGPEAGGASPQAQFQNPLKNKNVLVLHALESTAPFFKRTDRALSAALESGGISIREQFYEFIDLRRNPGAEHRRRFAELLQLRYGRCKIDAIITMYPEALHFMLNEGGTIFPDAPVLALYLPIGFEPPATSRRFIGQFVVPDLTGTLDIALTMLPKTKRVYIVSGAHMIDRWLEDRARQDFKQWEDRLEFRYLNDMTLEEILAIVSRAPPDSIVFTTTFANDVNGKLYNMKDVTGQLGRVSSAPVFGLFDMLIGHGIVGGSVISFEHVGTRAGELVLEILRGTKTADHIPAVLEVPPMAMFDWRQLRHWNLDGGNLPAGSIVLNKQLTFWDFKYHIIGALVFIMVQSFLITGLLWQQRRRRSAEASLHQKSKELDQFFNVSMDLLCIANTDGYFLRLNPVWEKTLGYHREELMAQRFLDFVHPDDLVRTQEAISTLAAQQGVIHFENRYRCKDGNYRWIDWSSVPVRNLIFAVARDVTERKHAEGNLKERLRFEQLLSDLSARFVNISPDRVDTEIEYGMKQILEFFQVDRCALLHGLPDRSSWKITHLASSEYAPPVPKGSELPQAIHPWAYEKLTAKGEVVSFANVDEMPNEARVDKQTWLDWGIRSNLVIPILRSESVVYLIAINSVRIERVWPEQFIPRLRLLGEIFVIALKRRQAEAASRETERILRHSENDLRKLAGRLIYAQEKERSRLARELHDDLAQRLAVFAIDVGRLQQQLVDPPVSVQEDLNEMKKDIIEISQEVHDLSRQLHPSILDDLGLIKAVESECTNFSRREGVEIVFNHENILTSIPKDVSLSLYRIIQESLSNVSKHACANHISVSLKCIGRDIFLSVQDDGIGFDPEEVREKPGLGFSSMRERAILMNGEFSIHSLPERGTEIDVRVPLKRKGA